MATNPTTIDLNKIDHEAAHDLRARYDQRPRGQGYRYLLRDVSAGSASVYDDAQYAYRGTVIQCNGAGLSGRCLDKWQVFYEGRDSYARPEDTNDPAVLGLAEFADQQMHGDYELFFRTRHDAALFALLA